MEGVRVLLETTWYKSLLVLIYVCLHASYLFLFYIVQKRLVYQSLHQKTPSRLQHLLNHPFLWVDYDLGF